MLEEVELLVLGFGSVNAMRRSFLRVLKVVPSGYRKRFRATDVDKR